MAYAQINRFCVHESWADVLLALVGKPPVTVDLEFIGAYTGCQLSTVNGCCRRGARWWPFFAWCGCPAAVPLARRKVRCVTLGQGADAPDSHVLPRSSAKRRRPILRGIRETWPPYGVRATG